MARITGLLGQTIAVRDLDAAVNNFERAGFALSTRSMVTRWGIETATFGFQNGSFLELVTPVRSDSEVGATVAAFLERRGEGLYLSTFAVDDVRQFHGELVGKGLPIVGPPELIASARGIDSEVVWLRPRASAGGFVQFLSFRGERHREAEVTDGVRRLFTQVWAVRDLQAAISSFEALGLEVWARYCTEIWGLDTAILRLPDNSNVELVSPADHSRPTSATVQAFIDRCGQGLYMTVLEHEDVGALFDRLEKERFPTLGAPAIAPPESPWGACTQLWLHPRATNAAFIELLTLPSG
jgi:hypothetical protein